MRPTIRTTPDDWARANRVYGAKHDRPGPRDPGLTPYLVPFQRAFDRVEQVNSYGVSYDAIVLACGAQMGKSDSILDIAGWCLDQRPAPIMYVGPNKEFLHREIEPRLMEMLTGTSRLKDKLATGKRMTRFRKVVGGVPMALAWAGSATSLRAMAAKYVLVDELDAMESSIQGEGDPFALAEARGFSFRDRVRAAISTPVSGTVDVERDPETGLEFWRPMDHEEVASKIWRQWQSGTMHHFAWPCPHCDEFFIPRFKQLRWPDGASPAEARRSAFVECPRCGGVIEDEHKAHCNARGVYVAPGQRIEADGTVTGDPPDTTTLSFWVSGLCSPFVTFGERAASYVTAKLSGEQDKIQAVVNTGFGECYAPGAGDVPEWEEVASLKRGYSKRTVPAGARILTLSVDVQRRSLVYVIRGWGAKASSWQIDAGEIHGNTTEPEVWERLDEMLTTPIDGLPIHKCFIDSGFRPGKPFNVPVNKVYEFCRRYPRRVYPTKGRATQDKPLVVSKHEVTQRGEARKYGLDLIWLDTDYFKSWVHERVRWPVDAPGFWVLPEDTTDDYCKQIVSEARVRKPNGAPTWVQRARHNHFLDCEALQAALAHMISAHLLREPESTSDRTAEDVSAPPRSMQAPRSDTPRPAVRASRPPDHKPAPVVSPAVAAARTGSRADRRARIADLANRLYGRT